MLAESTHSSKPKSNTNNELNEVPTTPSTEVAPDKQIDRYKVAATVSHLTFCASIYRLTALAERLEVVG